LRTPTRALALPALAAVAVGLLGAFVVAESDHVDHKSLTIVIAVGIAAAWIGTGLYAWWRRPRNRVGALMTWTGFAWLLNAFVAANSPAIFTLAVITSSLYVAAFVHLLLAYPDGKLRCRLHVRLVQATYALALIGPIPLLLSGLDEACPTCPDSVIQVTSRTTIGTIGDVVASAAAVALASAIVYALTRRWRSATAPQRRSLAPLLWSGVALMVIVALTVATQTVAGEQVPGVLPLAGQIVFASIPFTFMIGLLRGYVARSEALGALLERLGRASGTDGLRGLLADALGDRSLQLLYWVDNSWVHRDGRPATLPAHGDRRRAWTPVELEGQRVGAMVHDASAEPEALASLAAAAGLAMRGERLEAALRRSRKRIVEAGLAERRRLERNLHDGAQQRLVALSLTLRIAQNKIANDPEKAAEMVGAAQEELTRALEELRELARGIHPAVLSDRGLGPAVEALAVRSPLPVRVVEVPGERLPEPVEAAAYFVIAEALTNVVKYANASTATVAVRRTNGHAEVEVRDDGVGGADPGRGSGLRGLADRVGALDGSLALDSPPGSGTTLRAEIPV
jgi:signal transduction histidine kinase